MKACVRFTKVLFSALMLASTALLWVQFAPTQVGGKTSYVIIHGSSMEPRYHFGDLVIVRAAQTYNIHDAIAYQHPEIGIVFHRIVARSAERFTLQGDNNDYLDPYQPTQADILGKQWLHLPEAGNALVYMRQPLVFTGLVVIITLVGFNSLSQPASRGARRKTTYATGLIPMSNFKQNTIEMFYMLTLLAVASMALGVFSYTRPSSAQRVETITYEQQVKFSYTAASAGDLYDEATIQAGEPIFRRLTDSFTIISNYYFLSAEPATLGGSYTIYAEVSNASGWKRTVQLSPATSFEGANFTATSVVDLNTIQELIDLLEKNTGVTAGNYTLTVFPVIQVQGGIAGQEFADEFVPTLQFHMNALQLQLANNMIGDSLSSTKVGAIPVITSVPNDISFFSLRIPVAVAQLISLGGLFLTALAMFALGSWVRRASRQTDLSTAERAYQSLIIAVSDRTQLQTYLQNKTLFNVASLDDLARVAAQTHAIIARYQTSEGVDYYIHNGDVAYRYVFTPGQDSKPPRSKRGQSQPKTQLPPLDLLSGLSHGKDSEE